MLLVICHHRRLLSLFWLTTYLTFCNSPAQRLPLTRPGAQQNKSVSKSAPSLLLQMARSVFVVLVVSCPHRMDGGTLSWLALAVLCPHLSCHLHLPALLHLRCFLYRLVMPLSSASPCRSFPSLQCSCQTHHLRCCPPPATCICILTTVFTPCLASLPGPTKTWQFAHCRLCLFAFAFDFFCLPLAASSRTKFLGQVCG